MNRPAEVLIAALGVVMLSPLLALVSVLLWFCHGRPVIFRQVRIGRYGEPFAIWKFRTMRFEPGPAITVCGDDRIHPLGGVLRRSKLDELPQLVNVLRGQMSLVGPRPEVPEYVAYWPPVERQQILSVRPGITDPAAVRFRHESEILAQSDNPHRTYVEEIMPAKVAMYTDYVDSRTLVRDLSIILATLRAVLTTSGATQ